ncbi:MAG: hypothetical protein HY700_19460 [Gemmatimonadetes bacterium]|nr:hypothetical protein [Gemmatimonadota bacterium]
MTWLYLHLALNHFPVTLTVLGTTACVIGVARGSREAWLYGLITLAIAAACSIPSWITGYQAHYVLENKLQVAEGVVEPHELLAEATMWIMIPMGALAAFGWWRAREEPGRGPSPSWVRPAILTAAVTGTVMLGITAFLGGRIGHGKPQRPPTGADSAAAAQQSFQPIPLDTSRAGTRDTTLK